MSTLRSAAVLTGSSALFLLVGIVTASAHARSYRIERAQKVDDCPI